ncbi:MAG: hypothetical protein CL811_02255 [Colwelliaceae bacterium]|nr:hypothetical protein [Colwelliaceae bacterium]
MNATDNAPLLSETVGKVLKQSAIPAALTINECAKIVAMSATSFRRKLAQEETSFKLIQQKYLNELCVRALLTKQDKIDKLAISLGYSERATFERAFRQKFGLTPHQFRELSIQHSALGYQKDLIAAAKNLTPMPKSCKQLLKEKEQDSLDLEVITNIVNQDPVLSARVIGQASKAVYGKTPSGVKEAISRNLGINTVINLAVVYALNDAMAEKVDPLVLMRYTAAFVFAPKLFQKVRQSTQHHAFLQNTLDEQVLAFGLFGVLLLTQEDTSIHQLVRHSVQGIDDISSLNNHLRKSLKVSLFASSSLLLSLWHIDAQVIKQLHHLDQVCQGKAKATTHDDILLLIFNCLYRYATGHTAVEDLVEKAELLNIEGFEEITAEIQFAE